ncbi:MAG TPA: D-alanyl-D-alanine carboxypeptidase family protein [Pyrinomonadaceae bacterium]|nr:D-alanyl-D-alanine carboxypeptidase family protein [Pyrinomonadaceae bacterium]
MKNGRVHVWFILITLAMLVSVFSFRVLGGGDVSRTQPSPPQRDLPVKTTALKTPTKPANANAAAQNAVLKNELSWTFGGKQQHGWYLYDLLIGKTLNTNAGSVDVEFASAVASWQKRRGLGASGVLDESSWMALVAQWQGNRLKNRTSATPDQLITAPPSDFYDPSRAPELRQVQRETHAAYKQMIAAAIADRSLNLKHMSSGELAPAERFFKIVSAYRTPEYQQELRRKSPNSGSAGLAVNNSPHFTGRALDLYVGGDPVDTKDSNRAIQVNTPAYRWLVKNAERFGFRPYFYEPWHWEYVK